MARSVGVILATAVVALLFASPAFSQNSGGQPKWQKLEADNGAVYQINMNSISHYNTGAAEVVVYAVEGPGFSPENMRRLWFDCQGHFRDQTGPGFGPTQYAAPRSVAGRIGEIACAGAKDTRFTSIQTPQSQTAPSSLPESQVRTPGKLFSECLQTEGKSGPYTTAGSALDGARSVTSLLSQCKAQWDAWQNECIAKGGPNGDLGGCSGRAYRTAYEILQKLGK